jgi:hypothetical protein
VLTDVSEKHIASVFRVEEKRRKSASEEPAWAVTNRLMSRINPGGYFFFFLLPWRWRWYVPPKRLLTQYLHGCLFHSHRRENLKSCIDGSGSSERDRSRPRSAE